MSSPLQAPGRRTLHRCPALAAMVLLAGAGLSSVACSPIYVIKAGIAEARILAARRPIGEVVRDPATTDDTRGKLMLSLEARDFARDALGLDIGDTYTSFAQLEKDTLALVLSAAYRDRLESRTWWFPIIGRVPYRGYFSVNGALSAQRNLEEEGFDTYLRPTAAFSTLGWFADPILSTLLRYDHVDLIETILHELAHNHLFVGGKVRFNESYATFVGRVGAIEFFCTRPGGGPDTVWCQRARARWRDTQRFSSFLDELVAELEELYQDPAMPADDKVTHRQEVFERYQALFRSEVQPEFESLTFGVFLSTPLNNATLLARMRYYHRLPDFAAFYAEHGSDLRSAVAALKEGVRTVEDPFDLLPRPDPILDRPAKR